MIKKWARHRQKMGEKWAKNNLKGQEIVKKMGERLPQKGKNRQKCHKWP